MLFNQSEPLIPMRIDLKHLKLYKELLHSKFIT